MTYLISINKYYFLNIQGKQHIQEQNLVSEKRSKVHENCSNTKREKFKIYKSLSIFHNLKHVENFSNFLTTEVKSSKYRGNLRYTNVVYTMPTLNCTVP